MPEPIVIRSATAEDAPALREIYRPFVEETSVSFETAVPSIEEFASRISSCLAGWQWLVAQQNGECVAYAYGSSHRARAAYHWSVEVSSYVHPAHHRRGIGRALYARLLHDLSDLGYCNAYAGITLPNDSSVAFHRSFGFETIGIFRDVGRKFGRWHDVIWLQRKLRDEPPWEP